MRHWLLGGLAMAGALVGVCANSASASESAGSSAATSPVKSSHCRWMGVNSPPGGTSYASTSVDLTNDSMDKPASFEAWTYCIGNHWMIGARFGDSAEKPFVWAKGVTGVQTPGLVVTKMLGIYPGAPPVIVISTGTGYNWTTYDFFTVHNKHVVPFVGGIGYQGKYPVQLRDSGGAGDYFHFSCSREGTGAIVLTQQEYGGKDWSGPGPGPRTYEVTSYEYVARSGTRFTARKLPSKVVPSADLSFAPSQFC